VKRGICGVTILALLLMALAGCSSSRSVAGTYVNEQNPNDTIELNRDGTFYMSVIGVGGYGEYEVKGDTITFKFEDGSAARAELRDGNIVFPANSVIGFYGTTWKKQ